MQQLKFNIWGHNSVILHEHEVCKNKGFFAILWTNRDLRERFLNDLNTLIETTSMTLEHLEKSPLPHLEKPASLVTPLQN